MTGIATARPASGPAAPMSMSFLRSVVTRRMPMTAPIVPRPNHGRERDEERQRRVDAVPARDEVVPELVAQEDEHAAARSTTGRP